MKWNGGLLGMKIVILVGARAGCGKYDVVLVESGCSSTVWNDGGEKEQRRTD